jgi:riboflavin-specific deaminase-like protein
VAAAKPRRRRARPEVSVNFALTWDGKISTRNKTRSDFSSPRDKHRLLEIRATADAVLVGKRTVERENMSIGLPNAALRAERVRRGQPPYPLRVIVTNSGRIDPGLGLFSKRFSPIHIFSTSRMPAAIRAALAGSADVHLSQDRSVDLNEMLSFLRSVHGVKRLVCEGGPTLLRSLLERDLVDEMHITFCPLIFGGARAPTLTGLPGGFFRASTKLRLVEHQVIGAEWFLHYRVRR